MKKIIICLFSVAMAGSAYAQSDSEDEKGENTYPTHRNVFSINPFNFFDGTMQMDFERRNAKLTSSINLSAGMTAVDNSYYGSRYGFNAEVQLRHYVVPPSAEHNRDFFYSGLFAGVFGKAGQLTIENEETNWYYDNFGNYVEGEPISQNADYNHASTGVLMGIQFSYMGKLNMEAYMGGGVRYAKHSGTEVTGYYGVWDPGYVGVIPRFGFKVGIEF